MQHTERTTDEAELPYRANGWMNLYLSVISFRNPRGNFPAGTTFFGCKLHPSKAIAESEAGLPGTAAANGHAEWIGAFEVEE